MLETFLAILAANWSFIAVAFILGLVGEVIKSIVIGEDKEAAKKVKWKAMFIKTLPLHPVVAGGFLGVVLFATLPEAVATGGLVGSMLYFSASGALSTWLYAALKSLAPKLTKAAQKYLTDKVKSGSKSGSDSEPDES